MVKQLFLVFVAGVQPIVTQGQKPGIGPELSSYFVSINLAAREIHKDNFEAASRHYTEAFRHKSLPFFSDLKNAIIVNSRLGYHEKNADLLKITLRDKHLDTS